MKRILASLTLSFFLSSTLLAKIEDPSTDKTRRKTIVSSVITSISDLIPLGYATFLSLTLNYVMTSANFAPNHALGGFWAQHGIREGIPLSAVLGALKGKVEGLAGGSEDPVEARSKLREQDRAIADALVNIPVSFLIAVRLAASADAAPRIALVFGSYVIFSGNDSILEHFKNGVAYSLDYVRGAIEKAENL